MLSVAIVILNINDEELENEMATDKLFTLLV
jgi:hypothetical protein